MTFRSPLNLRVNSVEFCRSSYALQMRGYGGSDVPPSVQDYRVERLSDDIRDVILKLGYENVRDQPPKVQDVSSFVFRVRLSSLWTYLHIGYLYLDY